MKPVALFGACLWLSACANSGPAPTSVLPVEPRLQDYFVLLEAEDALTTTSEPWVSPNGELNLSAMEDAEPQQLLATEAFRLWEPGLEAIAPVVWLGQEETWLDQVHQEYLDIGHLLGKERLAKKQWRQFHRTIQAVQKELQSHKAALVLFYHNGTYYAHGEHPNVKTLQHVFGLTLADEHLAAEKKVVDASYLRYLQPDVVIIFSETGDHEELPEEAAYPVATPKVIALSQSLWEAAELSPSSLQGLAKSLRDAQAP